MADSEASETTQIEVNKKTPEKDQPEPMEEAEAKAKVEEEEAPDATENGHQTDEVASKVPNIEEPAKDNDSAEQTEEAIPKVEKEEETAKETENGDQVVDEKETAEPSKDTETENAEPSKNIETENAESSKDAEMEDAESSKDTETKDAEPSKDTEDAELSKDTETQNAKPSEDAKMETDEPGKDAETKTAEPSKDAENENAEPSKDAEEKKSEESQEGEKGHGATVAKHYNEHKENTREERKTSRIFFLRNFNNWVKSVLINEFMEKYKKGTFHHLNVLDLACGKGGDLLKWQKAKISNLVCADIADVSIKQCQQRYKDLRYSRNHRRYNQSQQIYDAQFITADCTKEDISEKFHARNKNVKFDMTSCQFALHYAFESPEQAEKMLQNACERLKPGGYFIGTIPCANELINRLRQSEEMSFENECYKISFEEKDNISLFGQKYNFHLEGAVDCPEFLVHFPLLEKMAEKFGLTLELAQGFHNFFDDHKEKAEYKFLLSRMNSLETYPPRKENDKPVSEKEDAYTQAKEILDAVADKDKKSHVGTLSKDEWEAAGLYMVFAFKKAQPEPEPTPMEEDKKEVAETEQPGEDDKKDEDKKDDEQIEDKKIEQDAETKMDQDGEDDKKDEGADKKDEEEVKKDEEVDKKDEEADKKDEEADKKDEEADKKDEEADKKDEEADKKDEEANQKDEDDKAGDASTEAEQAGDAGEQGGEAEKPAETEDTKEAEKLTPQRGRRKRSVGAAKEEADTPEEETTSKRGTRKRKSTGGAEEEPPEKKKA